MIIILCKVLLFNFLIWTINNYINLKMRITLVKAIKFSNKNRSQNSKSTRFDYNIIYYPGGEREKKERLCY